MNDEISLPELEDWFLPNLGQILSLPTCQALDLAGDLQLVLAEMSSGDKTEAELKSVMRNLVESTDTVICAIEPYSISTGTTNPAPIMLDSITPSDADVYYVIA